MIYVISLMCDLYVFCGEWEKTRGRAFEKVWERFPGIECFLIFGEWENELTIEGWLDGWAVLRYLWAWRIWVTNIEEGCSSETFGIKFTWKSLACIRPSRKNLKLLSKEKMSSEQKLEKETGMVGKRRGEQSQGNSTLKERIMLI